MAGMTKYALRKAGEKIARALKDELRAQGHYDTGRLEDSIKVKVVEDGGTYDIQVYSLGYLEILNKGQAASQVKRLDGAQLNKLAGWIQRKGGSLSYKLALSAARAISYRWRQEGKPLEGSEEFSSTGEVLGALDIVIRESWAEFKFILDEEMIDELDIQFHKVKSGKV
jgi:hypothetical protein